MASGSGSGSAEACADETELGSEECSEIGGGFAAMLVDL